MRIASFLFLLTLFSLAEVIGQEGGDLTPLEFADSLYSQKQYDAALSVLNSFTDKATASQNWPGLVTAYSQIAKNYNRKRDYKQRLAATNKALQTASLHLSNVDSIYAKALKENGDAFIRVQAYDSSIYYLEKAETIYLKNADWNLVASCRVGIGSNLYRTRAFVRADSVLTSTLALMEERLDPLPNLYGTVLNLIGAIHNQTGDYEKALENSIKSVRFREARSSKGERLLFAYNNLGLAYHKRTDYEKAREALERAEIIGDAEIENVTGAMSRVYNNLMLVHLKKKSYHQALTYAQKRLQLISDYELELRKESQAVFANNIAVLYIETGQFDKALTQINTALRLNKESAQTQANLGYYLYRTNQMPAAETALKQAIDSYGNNKSPDIAKLYRYLAEIASLQNKNKAAIDYFDQSIAIAAPFYHGDAESSGIRSKRELLRALVSKSRHLLKSNESLSGATETLLSAVDLVDVMYKEHKAEGSRLFLKAEALPLYELAIGALLKAYQQSGNEQTLNQAFEIFEKGKSSQLGDLLQVKNANLHAGVPTYLIERERTLQIEIAFYESEQYLADDKADQARSALYQKYKLEKINELDKLIEQFENEYPRYFQARHNKSRPSVEEVRKNLSDDELLIEFFVGETTVYALAISSSDATMLELGNSTTLQADANVFIRASNNVDLVLTDQTKAFQELSNQGSTLYKKLLQPVFDQFGQIPGALHLIPDGFLNFLPFEALLTSEIQDSNTNFTDLPYLIRSMSVRYSYAAHLPQFSSGSTRSGKKVLAMAPFGEEDLKHSIAEIEETHKHFKAQLFQGQTGTERQFIESAPGYEILHLATHGTIDTQNPQQSYLRFADNEQDTSNDNRLHVYELENMRLSASLAVLSACETGSGSFVQGEGVMSLARSFAYAGVPSVLMSLWQVDDRSGGSLISQFYQGLSAQMDKAQALRAAKLTHLNNADQLHAHPYFWSQFVLIGEPAPLPVRSSLNFPVILIVVSVTLVILILLLILLSQHKTR